TGRRTRACRGSSLESPAACCRGHRSGGLSVRTSGSPARGSACARRQWALLAASGDLVWHHLKEFRILLGPPGDSAAMHELRDPERMEVWPSRICAQVQLAHLEAYPCSIDPAREQPLDLGPGLAIAATPQESGA